MKLIPLSQGKFATVDDTDYEAVSQFKWCLSGNGYAHRHLPGSGHKGETQYLHHFLMPGIKGIDHKDGNKLNDCRDNLRPATPRQNMRAFRRKAVNVSSQFRGVCWCKEREKWVAGIKFLGKRIALGRFYKELNAAKAYDEAAKKYFGDRACPNFP